MGLSTTYANVVLFAVVLFFLTAMMTIFSDYMTKTSYAVKIQGDYLQDRLDTSVRIDSISSSTSDTDVRFFVVNDGKTILDVNCTDFYIDRQWISRDTMVELKILNTTFDEDAWNPGETVKMRATHPMDNGVPHEARVVTCNGVSDTKEFYW
jgi:archaellum component FlaG (FlaF/FlaG flagellin family)